MKKFKLILSLALFAGLNASLYAQEAEVNTEVDTEIEYAPIQEPIYLDSPPPRGLLSKAEKQDLSSLSIYPNPSAGLIKIHLGTETNAQSIQVFDLSGQLRFEQKIDPLSKMDPSVDLRPLPDGVYVVRVGNHAKKYRKVN